MPSVALSKIKAISNDADKNLLLDAVVFASGVYLTEYLPRDFVDSELEALNEFLEENIAEAYEDWDVNAVWKAIVQSAQEMVKFHKFILKNSK